MKQQQPEFDDTTPEEFLDAESYGGHGGGATTFQMLVLNQLSRIMRLGSKEFIGGYWIKIQKKDVGFVEKYVEDTRANFINAIQSLYDISEGYFVDDDSISKIDKTPIIKKGIDEWNTTINNFDRQYADKEKSIGKFDNEAKKTNYQNYMNAKAELFRNLFRLLAGFCKRQDYFGEMKGRAG